jgi:uncharacterized coiled-coil DUF342 family protein
VNHEERLEMMVEELEDKLASCEDRLTSALQHIDELKVKADMLDEVEGKLEELWRSI